MHGGTDGALIEFLGHTLTADEWHSFLYGLFAGLLAISEKVSNTIAKEPPYFLAGLALSYAIVRRLR